MMTKNYFIQLAEYNIWANDIVHSWFTKISDEQWNQPVISSFDSIGETALHTAGAEKVWMERLNKLENPVLLTTVFKGSKNELMVIWKKASKDLRSFVGSFEESKLGHLLSFTRANGVQYKLPYYQVLAHVFNHSTYHRGQIVTMLRQTGFTDITSTDLSVFFNNQKN